MDTYNAQTEWEKMLKKEQLAEARKEGRRLARFQDTSRSDGRIAGICDAANFFIGRDRVDIAQALLKHFMVDRDRAEAALQADKRTRSMTFASLDKVSAWFKTPKA